MLRVGEAIRAGAERYQAIRDIFAGERPRIRGLAPGAKIQTTDLDAMKALALGLDASYLFIQGPPGTCKTWTGARIVVHLLACGRRVGIAAQSHKAIHNLLAEIERVAREAGVRFSGLKKSTGNPESEYVGTSSRPTRTTRPSRAPAPISVSWRAPPGSSPARSSTARSTISHPDEAGQLSLADALAMGASARNLTLLGDPLQLAQVSQAVHPAGTGASVLEHLLADAPTIPEDRGIFLERSFRMHPGVSAFISEIVYAGRLHSDPSAGRRTTSAGTGSGSRRSTTTGTGPPPTRRWPRSRDGSPACAGARSRTRTASRVPSARRTSWWWRPTTPRCSGCARSCRRASASAPRQVQGQEAPIVFFSMATSSGEDVPRSLSFLFSRNRLNVAISRAQCLAVLVCSPRLLDARCQSIEEMQLVNALCRLVEYAGSSDA